MRNGMVIGSLVILALSLMITGTILAQDGDSPAATAWLGLSFSESDGGVVVQSVVSGSPAEMGGVLEGDVLVSFDGQAIESADALTDLVQAHAPGDVIELVVMRDAGEQTLSIELGSTPGRREREAFSADTDPLVKAEKVLGVELAADEAGYRVLDVRTRPVDDADDTDTAETEDAEESDDDVDTEDDEDSEATQNVAALAIGDVITAVNGTPIADVDWSTLVTELAGQDDPALSLTVLRGDEEMAVALTSIRGMGGHGQRDSDRPDHGDGGRDRRPGSDNGQSGSSNSGGQSTEQGTAPHPVDPGTACSTCHGGSAERVPSSPSTEGTAEESTGA